MVFRDEGGAAAEGSFHGGAPTVNEGFIRPLNVPLLCWHESRCSARTDPLVALADDAGFIATDRPVPVGTTVFLELALGHASNAARAQIDAVVVAADSPVEMAGFVVRFVDVDDAVQTWIKRHLQSATQKRPVAAATPAALPAVAASVPGRATKEVPRAAVPPPLTSSARAASTEASLPRRLPLPSSAPMGDDPWSLPPPSVANPFAPASPRPSTTVGGAALAKAAVPARDLVDDDDELPEMADFDEVEETADALAAEPPAAARAPRVPASAVPSAISFDLGVAAPRAPEPASPAPPAAPEATPRSSLDVQVEEALGGLSDLDALTEDAFGLDLPEEGPLPGGEAFSLRDSAADAFLPEVDDDAPLPGGDPYDAGTEATAPDAAAASLMEDAFDDSFSPWVDLPTGESDADPFLSDHDDPFALDLPSAGEPLELVSEEEPPAPPDALSGEGAPVSASDEGQSETSLTLPESGAETDVGADDLAPDDAFGAGRSFDAFALPSEVEALTRPPQSVALDAFDPFADADAPAPTPAAAAAPLESAHFEEKPPASDDDDLDVDVFDESTGQPMAPPPPPRPREVPSLADAGIGFSNPFARASQNQRAASADIDDDDGKTQEELPRGPQGTLPWGVNRGQVLSEAERRADAGFGSPSPPSTLEVDADSATPSFGTPPPPPDAVSQTPNPSASRAVTWPGPPGAPEAPSSFPGTAPYPVAAAASDSETAPFGGAPGASPAGGAALRSPAPDAAAFAEPGLRRSPTLEFPQPGPASSPVPPPTHTPTLREFAAVNPPTPPHAAPAAAPARSSVPPAPRPKSLGIAGLGPEDDVVEVSTTSQLVRASEGGLASLVARDKAARFDMPVQSVTGSRGSVTVEAEAFRDPSRELDPFGVSRPAVPAPGPVAPPAAGPFPAPASAAPPLPPAAGQPAVWFPGEPARAVGQGPPTGVFGTAPPERPAEAWQVRGPTPPPASEPDELPLVTGITMLEEEELPLVQALPLDDEPTAPQEPWVIGGGRGDGKG